MSRYQLSLPALLVRTLLASAGGYALAWSFCAGGAILCAHLFGMSRGDAVVMMAMLAFLMWMMAVLVAFAASSAWRAAAWVLGGIGLFAAVAWGLGPLPAPGLA